MTTGYQHLWANTYGEIGGAEYLEWARAINPLPAEKVKAAIAELIQEGAEYPPNLIKFLRYCRKATPAMYKAVQLPPPPVRQDPQAAAKAFAEWGQINGFKPAIGETK